MAVRHHFQLSIFKHQCDRVRKQFRFGAVPHIQAAVQPKGCFILSIRNLQELKKFFDVIGYLETWKSLEGILECIDGYWKRVENGRFIFRCPHHAFD